MPDQTSYQTALESYRRLLDEATVKRPGADRDGSEVLAGDRLGERAPEVQVQSAALREALEPEVTAGAPQVRELASLQLLSAMALDLTVSYGLAAAQQPTTGAGDRSVRMPPGLGELQQVLVLDTRAGMDQTYQPADRGTLPKRPKAARIELEKTLVGYVQAIPQNAAALSKGVADNAIKLGAGSAQTAASLAGHGLLAALPVNISGGLANAASMLAEAIKKLRAALGPEQEKVIVDQAGGWWKETGGSQDAVTRWLNRLYETERITKEVQGTIQASSAHDLLEAGQYNQANASLKDLLERSNKTRSTLTTVLRVISFVQPVLLNPAAVPWGPVGLYATYAGMLGYAVFSGGDYLDWYRIEWDWLDRVVGLRAVVAQAMARPAVGPVTTPAANPVQPR